jgi:hypothetical protein
MDVINSMADVCDVAAMAIPAGPTLRFACAMTAIKRLISESSG